jgi:hypothetical protein
MEGREAPLHGIRLRIGMLRASDCFGGNVTNRLCYDLHTNRAATAAGGSLRSIWTAQLVLDYY